MHLFSVCDRYAIHQSISVTTYLSIGEKMGGETIFSVQQALDVIEHMPLEDQMTVIEVLQRRLLVQRRSEIARNAVTTRQAVHEGRARYGTVDDLKQDLNS
jgi:hypothetical protein